jgi:hypothetical protein
MRKAGATFDQIASSLAYSDKGSAYRSVMGLLVKQNNEAAEPLRRLEVERCDRLQLAVWADAIGGNLKAIETCLRVMERRARLLGLDQSPELALQLNTGTVINVITAIPRPPEIVEAEVKLLEGGRGP